MKYLFLVFAVIFYYHSVFCSGTLNKLRFDEEDSIRLKNTIDYFNNIDTANLEQSVRLLLPSIENKFNFKVLNEKLLPKPDENKIVQRSIWLYKSNEIWETLSESQKENLRVALEYEYNKISIDAFSAYACLCNKTKLPDDFFQLLDMKIKMGGYELTHAAIQYRNLYINGCISNEQYILMRDQIASRIVSEILLKNPNYNSILDLKIEAAACLYYLESPLIYTESVLPLIQNVFKYQDINGGWLGDKYGRITQHASLLGLWLLLQIKADAN